MARTLFPGCDVWLNNPLRPLEACGTSGMKAAINGSLNLSVMDGWWDEMYDGENGWAIPTANNDASPEERDDIEAAALYELLETQVAPRFYGSTVSDSAGAAGPSSTGREKVPTHWVSMIKHTLSHLGPAVSADRMLHDYVNVLYRPAAVAGRKAVADSYAQARSLAAWTAKVRAAWPLLHVEHVDSVGVSEDPQIGDTLQVNAYVALTTLTPDDVSVEVAYGRAEESDTLADVTIDGAAAQGGPGRWPLSVQRLPGDRPLRPVWLHRPRPAPARGVGVKGRTGADRQRLTVLEEDWRRPSGRCRRSSRHPGGSRR